MDGLSIFIILILLFLSAGLYIYIRRMRKAADILADSIKLFLDKGEKIPFSTEDNRFSYLHGLISELQDRYINEKINRERDRKETSEFVSDVSHQLKTPLAGLKLYCEMEYNEHPAKNTEREIILIEKMQKLIADILNLEKISSCDADFNFEEKDLKITVENLISDFTCIYPHKNFTLTGEGKLRIDEKYFSEALGNVIKNAAEHTKEDGNIDISIEARDKTVFISVEDNGGGIDEKDIPEIFTRFHKLKNASEGSSGIGLAVTKAITQKHHGSVFASNGSKGLKVTLCFPVIEGRILQ